MYCVNIISKQTHFTEKNAENLKFKRQTILPYSRVKFVLWTFANIWPWVLKEKEPS